MVANNSKFNRKKTGFPARIFLPVLPVFCLFYIASGLGSAKATKTSVPMTAVVASDPQGAKPITVLFKGGSNSSVSKSVGLAEGTRTIKGGKTPAYYRHPDPGNGVINVGTFSYQHAASSPEDADSKQIPVLKAQAIKILVAARKMGITMTLAEAVNGVDLYNQAPKAVWERGGYLDTLKKAKSQNFTGEKAIIEARTKAFWNPNTMKWDAEGLGSNEDSVRHDQTRRAGAISQALDAAGERKNQKVSPSSLYVAAKNFYRQKPQESFGTSEVPKVSVSPPEPTQLEIRTDLPLFLNNPVGQ